jgi:hypothetical protein
MNYSVISASFLQSELISNETPPPSCVADAEDEVVEFIKGHSASQPFIVTPLLAGNDKENVLAELKRKFRFSFPEGEVKEDKGSLILIFPSGQELLEQEISALVNHEISDHSKKIFQDFLAMGKPAPDEKKELPSTSPRDVIIWQLCEFINFLERGEQSKFFHVLINSDDPKDRFHACYAMGQSGRAEYYELLFSQLRLDDSDDPLIPLVKKESRTALRRIVKKELPDLDIMQTKAFLRRLMEKAGDNDEKILALDKPWRWLSSLEKEYETSGPSPGMTVITTGTGMIVSDGPLTDEQIEEMENAELIGFVPELFQKKAKK